MLPAVGVAVAAVGIGASWHFPIAGILGVTVAVLLIAVSSFRFVGKGEQLYVVRLTETTVHNGPATVFLPPLSYRSANRVKAYSLTDADYLKVKDTVGGSVRIEQGPQLVFLDAYDEVITNGTCISLSKMEYLVVADQKTGESQTVRGPAAWFPGPYDNPSLKRTAISLSEDEYIRIADVSKGQRKVVQGKALFFLNLQSKLKVASKKLGH